MACDWRVNADRARAGRGRAGVRGRSPSHLPEPNRDGSARFGIGRSFLCWSWRLTQPTWPRRMGNISQIDHASHSFAAGYLSFPPGMHGPQPAARGSRWVHRENISRLVAHGMDGAVRSYPAQPWGDPTLLGSTPAYRSRAAGARANASGGQVRAEPR
ncbi:hypothetical protein CALCODRAFT_67282 [Calocera cornea HHB12733]|uniref:Uncharacterized protein n=1 Tax=Calocera cornea HHB12733 TaxID=1353952 RepID=A0A165DJA8_9BASI|nr:hypothetical protein CALCODRAFT_67282 [Calocera cornea HHB12733]